jgi:hypothetical protein
MPEDSSKTTDDDRSAESIARSVDLLKTVARVCSAAFTAMMAERLAKPVSERFPDGLSFPDGSTIPPRREGLAKGSVCPHCGKQI